MDFGSLNQTTTATGHDGWLFNAACHKDESRMIVAFDERIHPVDPEGSSAAQQAISNARNVPTPVRVQGSQVRTEDGLQIASVMRFDGSLLDPGNDENAGDIELVGDYRGDYYLQGGNANYNGNGFGAYGQYTINQLATTTMDFMRARQRGAQEQQGGGLTNPTHNRLRELTRQLGDYLLFLAVAYEGSISVDMTGLMPAGQAEDLGIDGLFANQAPDIAQSPSADVSFGFEPDFNGDGTRGGRVLFLEQKLQEQLGHPGESSQREQASQQTSRQQAPQENVSQENPSQENPSQEDSSEENASQAKTPQENASAEADQTARQSDGVPTGVDFEPGVEEASASSHPTPTETTPSRNQPEPVVPSGEDAEDAEAGDPDEEEEEDEEENEILAEDDESPFGEVGSVDDLASAMQTRN